MKEWYESMNGTIWEWLKHSVFYCLIKRLHCKSHNSALLQALAEKWWDITHTMHFDFLGEMIVTPKDFTCIIGLRFGGRPIKLKLNIHRQREFIEKYFGAPMLNHYGSTVEVEWLYKEYDQKKRD